MDRIKYDGDFIENSNDFEAIILTLIFENIDERADTEEVRSEFSKLMRAALAMARQEVLGGVISKAELISGYQQHYIDDIK